MIWRAVRRPNNRWGCTTDPAVEFIHHAEAITELQRPPAARRFCAISHLGPETAAKHAAAMNEGR